MSLEILSCLVVLIRVQKLHTAYTRCCQIQVLMCSIPVESRATIQLLDWTRGSRPRTHKLGQSKTRFLSNIVIRCNNGPCSIHSCTSFPFVTTKGVRSQVYMYFKIILQGQNLWKIKSNTILVRHVDQ